MIRRTMFVGIVALSCVSSQFGQEPKDTPARGVYDEIYQSTVEAYIRFLPRYYTFITQLSFTSATEPLSRPAAPLNRLGYRQSLIDARFQGMVRPNHDTLYASAFINVSREPVLMRVPETNGRFWSIQVTDVWTEVLAGLGTRHQTKPGLVAFVSPKWQGKLPDNVLPVPLVNPNCMVIIRVGNPSDPDPKGVRQLLHRFTLAPLSIHNQDGLPEIAPESRIVSEPHTSVRAYAAAMAENQPLTLLDQIRGTVRAPNTPLSDDDKTVLTRFEKHLNRALAEVANRGADQFTAAAMVDGLHAARRLIDARIRSPRRGDNGWVMIPCGEWGSRFLDRAAIAEFAIYANTPNASLYPETRTDDIGMPLTGENAYTLTFPKDALPPVEDFWSLSLYREDTLTFAANPINRFAVHERTPNLKRDRDGSLTVYIQHDSPGVEKESNWLPAPKDKFNLVLRLYGPKQAARDGTYKLPAVKRSE